MGYRRVGFAPDEHYHCYTRGIDGRTVFHDREDYERFQEALFLCNDSAATDRSDFFRLRHAEIFERPRVQELVAIGSYALMPNHFHLAFQELIEGGSSKFLQKLGTSYCMYYNAKYGRIGGLFVRPCRSKHIANERYFRHVIQYIHINIAELYEHGWKYGKVRSMKELERHLLEYRFSSLPDYAGAPRPERAILNTDLMTMIKSELPPLRDVLREAKEYYENLELDLV